LLLDKESTRAGLTLKSEGIHQHDDTAEAEGTMGKRRAGAGAQLPAEPDQRRKATIHGARSPFRDPLDMVRAGCEGHGHGLLVSVRVGMRIGMSKAIMRCAATG
jgi:hypothetical protein